MEERIEELIIEYLDGTISSQDQQTLDDLISEGVITRAEIEAYKKLYGSIDRIGITQPSAQMTDNFYAMLDEKIASNGPYTWLDRFAALFYHKGISRGGLQVAYSTIVLLLGLGVGYMIIGKSDKEQLSTLSQ